MGIDLINKLGLSYQVSTNLLFAITTDHTAVTLHTTDGTKKPEKKERILASMEHGAFPMLIGGPAIATWKTSGHCVVC
jgi:Leu/Phe-tRNA-protein transferase